MAALPVSAARSASGPYHLGRDKRGHSRCGLHGRSFFHNGRDAGCIGFETFLMQNLDKNETFLIQLRCNSRAAVWYNLARQD